MTNKEAINVINTWIMPIRKNISGEFVHEFLDAVEVMERNAIEYDWHDLRENPNDLPEDNARILFYTTAFGDGDAYSYLTGDFAKHQWGGVEFVNDDGMVYATNGCYRLDDIIAWKYIEPFEEKE